MNHQGVQAMVVSACPVTCLFSKDHVLQSMQIPIVDVGCRVALHGRPCIHVNVHEWTSIPFSGTSRY